MLNDTAFGKDRRQSRRYPWNKAEYVFVRHESDLDNVCFKKALLRNFSVSGVNISISEPIPPSSLVLIRLYEPYNAKSVHSIHALGDLVWQQAPNGKDSDGSIIVGVKFLHLEEDDASRLNMMSQYFELNKGRSPGRF